MRSLGELPFSARVSVFCMLFALLAWDYGELRPIRLVAVCVFLFFILLLSFCLLCSLLFWGSVYVFGCVAWMREKIYYNYRYRLLRCVCYFNLFLFFATYFFLLLFVFSFRLPLPSYLFPILSINLQCFFSCFTHYLHTHSSFLPTEAACCNVCFSFCHLVIC